MAVTGESGVASMDLVSQNLVEYSDRSGGVSWQWWGSNIDLLMMRAFCEAVARGIPVPVTGVDGLRAAAVALAAYRSAELGRPVPPTEVG